MYHRARSQLKSWLVSDGVRATPRRWLVFAVGITLLGSGVATSVVAGLGVGSWQVFETGLVAATGAPLGTIIVIESLVAVVLARLWLGQPPGIGTVIVALGVGPIVGWLVGVLPEPSGLTSAMGQFAVGTLAIGVGVGFYVAAELGPSAQDSLFVGLYRKYPIRVGAARFLLDGTLVAAGWFLGGQVGVGTVIVTLAMPPLVEWSLRTGQRLAGTAPTADPVPDEIAC